MSVKAVCEDFLCLKMSFSLFLFFLNIVLDFLGTAPTPRTNCNTIDQLLKRRVPSLQLVYGLYLWLLLSRHENVI